MDDCLKWDLNLLFNEQCSWSQRTGVVENRVEKYNSQEIFLFLRST